MRSPASAIAWQLYGRHRWGLAAIGAYLALVVFLVHSGVVEAFAAHFAPAAPAPVVSLLFGAMSTLPLVTALTYLLGVFCQGFQSDLIAPGSSYPTWMFRLPVPTRTLVLWPMLYGVVTLGLGWATVALLILQPCGLAVPVGWPTLLLAALLTWLQAILWWPFGLRGARLVVVALALGLLVAGLEGGKAAEFNATLRVSLFAVATLAGGLAALAGVVRARRGEEPDWQWLQQTIRQVGRGLPRRRQAFASAARAQVWFEWRRHGWTLPLMVAFLLPLFLWPLWLGTNEVLSLPSILLLVCLLPPFLAGLAGPSVSGSNPEARDYYGLPPFTGVRPMTCGGLLAAKVKMAALSTLTAWGVVVLVVPSALVLSGNLQVVADGWGTLLRVLPAWKAAGLLALVLVGLILVTWKQFVENLFIGLTGNAWVINGVIIVGLLLMVVCALLGSWIYHHPEYHEPLLAAVPWVMSLAVLLKLLAAGWAWRTLRRRQLLERYTLPGLLTLWLLTVLGLIAWLAWLIPTGMTSLFSLALGVVLFVPLARLLAAPLALAWNRHR